MSLFQIAQLRSVPSLRSTLTCNFKCASTSCGGVKAIRLIEQYIGEVIAFEDFEKPHRRGAGILDIMAHGKGNETDIAGTKVEGSRLTGSGEHAHTRVALK
jgi:hypothetical protein